MPSPQPTTAVHPAVHHPRRSERKHTTPGMGCPAITTTCSQAGLLRSFTAHTWNELLRHRHVVIRQEVHAQQVLGVGVVVQLHAHLVGQAHHALGNVVGGRGLATEHAHAGHNLCVHKKLERGNKKGERLG